MTQPAPTGRVIAITGFCAAIAGFSAVTGAISGDCLTASIGSALAGANAVLCAEAIMDAIADRRARTGAA